MSLPHCESRRPVRDFRAPRWPLLAAVLLLIGVPGFSWAEDERSQIQQLIDRQPKLPALPEVTTILDSDDPSFDLGQGLTCISSNVRQRITVAELVAFDPLADVLWPGSMVQGGSLASGLLAPIPLPRVGGTITLTRLTATGSPMPGTPAQSRTVTETTFPLVNEAIHDLLGQDLSSVTPADMTFEIKKVSSLREGMFQFRASADWIGGSAKGALESSFQEQENNFIVRLVQKYYTMSFSTPSGPTSMAFLGPSATLAEARRYIGPRVPTVGIGTGAIPAVLTAGYRAGPIFRGLANPPVYISSVTYGRQLIFVCTTKERESKAKQTLEATFSYLIKSGNLNLSNEQREVLKNTRIWGIALGGAARPAIELVLGMLGTEKTDKLGDFLTQGANFSLESPGVPVGYAMRYLTDRTMAQLSLTTNYRRHECQPLLLHEVALTIHTEDDDKDREEVVDIELYDGNRRITSIRAGQNQVWHDHTNQDFVLRVNPPISVTECGRLALRIRKQPYGSYDGNGWNMSMEAIGRVEGGGEYVLLGRTARREVGDGHRFDFTQKFDCGSPSPS